MEKKMILKRAVKKTAKDVLSGWQEDFTPRVAYLEAYLKAIKPGEGATRAERERYGFAVKCVKEMKNFIDPAIWRDISMRPCYWIWPVIPPWE